MTVQRLLAILFIFCCSTFAWFVLGTSVVVRTGESDQALKNEVISLWGGPHVQLAPAAWIVETEQRTETVEEKGPSGESTVRQVSRPVSRRHRVALTSSRINVKLELEDRRKGLLWYDLYAVDFSARYVLNTPDGREGPLHVKFDFPAQESIYDAFTFRVAGEEAAAGDLQTGVELVVEDVASGRDIPVEISYRSRGLDTWSYAFQLDNVTQVRDFELNLVADRPDVDFPAGTISPTAVSPDSDGVELNWQFDNLVTGKTIGVDLPSRLNPGPLTSRVTFFAPISLLFFLTVMVIVGIVQGRNLHPMHYFFLSAAFFSFHLLLAYLVDHIDIHAAFVIAASVSMALVISYLRVVGGTRFALARAGLAQLIYLVLFNYAFFFHGFTGLTITVGAVITLFVLMQITARVDWDRVFGAGRGNPGGPDPRPDGSRATSAA
jgi:hypothetical protein